MNSLYLSITSTNFKLLFIFEPSGSPQRIIYSFLNFGVDEISYK